MTSRWIWAAPCILLLAADCGSSGGTSPGSTGTDTSSGTGTSTAGSFAGVYSATYSGTYVVSSPAGQPNGDATSAATITIKELSDTEVRASWQVPPNPTSGTIDFALKGSKGTATGKQTGGTCFTGTIGNGNTQTNCCTKCTITFSEDGFVQPNAGTFTGVTPAGDAYSGTYSGTWIGTKQ
jgi:hypothetical protein